MNYQITSGIINSAQKVVIYGTEGIGKTTFASHFPDPLFIDTEGSTKKYNVNRLPKPTSWQMLLDEVKYVMQTNPCKTLVIDTADWAERLCTESICAKYGKKGIEDFGYGNGYTYVAEEWGRFLNLLQDIVDVSNINVVLTAHTTIRKFEQPNEMGSYDRYELKLGKKTTAQTAPITKEWADMVLFANYKTYSVAVDKDGKKHKAQGGQRVMYTSHHPCWDAKNRDGLAEELPFEYAAISHLFANNVTTYQSPIKTTQSPELEPAKCFDDEPVIGSIVPDIPKEESINEDLSDVPEKLAALMRSNSVTKKEIQTVVGLKGYFPIDTPIKNYDPDFVEGCLIGAWDTVFAEIKKERILPF